MARNKGSRLVDAVMSGILTTVFLALTLSIVFGKITWSGLRDSVDTRLLADNGTSNATTPEKTPVPTPDGSGLVQTTAIQFWTPVPVLATVNAIMTAHVVGMQATPAPTTTPVSILSVAPSSLEILATPVTIEVGFATPTAGAASPPTSTPPPGVAGPLPPALQVASLQILRSVTPTTETVDASTSVHRMAGTPATGLHRRRPSATPTPGWRAAVPVLIGSRARGGAIDLSWSFAGWLGTHDYFDVRVWQSGQPAYGIANVQQTGYTIGSNFPAGEYNWTVAVIRKHAGQTQTLSKAATILHFSWAPAE